ncbi:MAG: hypothetical protein KC493_14190 [Bacteriovoracaceae bacterium]|nr:hypothetical protein [Bacteriovoracaceae bacterium]
MKKTILFSSLFLFLSGCKYLEAPSMGLAKEMCSCLFVGEQTINFCKEVTKESRLLAKFKVDWKNKSVEARGTGHKSVAKLNDNARFGCAIVSVDEEEVEFSKNIY